jgi:hypothetical protein
MVAKGESPAPSQELIFLDPDDDLGTIRAKLESSSAEEVFLVVPRRAATLRTPLEYRILARMAHELSTDVVIVSTDAGRRYLARQEGLRSRRGYGNLRLLSGTGAPATPGWLPTIPEWLPLPSLAAIFLIGVLGALVLGFAFVALPTMSVTVTPASENVQRELELIVDPNQRTPDAARGILPGEILQYSRFDVTDSVPTTGQKNVGRDPARGEVVISNGSANPVVLPARTVVVAKNGARFLTDAEVRVNPFSYGVARVGVTAEQRGGAGNVEANQMAGVEPPMERLAVSNPKPMTGGSDRPAKAVAPADFAKVKELLLQRAREQAMAEFTNRAGSAKSVPPNSLQLRVEGENYQPPIDAEGDQLSGTITASATVVAWENQGPNSLNSLVQKMMLSRFGPEYDLPLGQLRLPPPEVLDAQNQRIRVKVRADAVVVHTLDSEQIAAELRGKSGAEARSILQGLAGVAGSPRIDVSPPWAPRAFRVEVAVAAPK